MLWRVFSRIFCLAQLALSTQAQEVATLPRSCALLTQPPEPGRHICKVNFCSGNYGEIRRISVHGYVPPVLNPIWGKQKRCVFMTKPYQVRWQDMHCKTTQQAFPKTWALSFEWLANCPITVDCHSLSLGNTHLSLTENPRPTWRRLCKGAKGLDIPSLVFHVANVLGAHGTSVIDFPLLRPHIANFPRTDVPRTH